MFRRLQRLQHERIASETLEHQPISSTLPNGNLQTINSGNLHQRQPPQRRQSTSSNVPTSSLLPVSSTSEAEAPQSLDSDSESKSSPESVGGADIAGTERGDETEALGNLGYRTSPPYGAGQRSITCEACGPWIHWSPSNDSGSRELHQNLDEERQSLDDELPFPLGAAEALQNPDYSVLPHGARQRSITYEVGPLGIRPLWTGGPWIQDCPDSRTESQDLPQILENEELQQNLDDETLLLDGLEWEERDFETATTVLLRSVADTLGSQNSKLTDTLGSQNSKSSSLWSSVL
eukprot:TRINITY_DN533_c0_g4_i1.p1 TRINITY_DN533_c0_g4~~TRINITY_DN533_c0_g4_i1.p1  ORF type:complete len:292 (+),score=50.53 TRINITY_DN533_c0_g4_i1:112-987(+)